MLIPTVIATAILALSPEIDAWWARILQNFEGIADLDYALARYPLAFIAVLTGVTVSASAIRLVVASRRRSLPPLPLLTPDQVEDLKRNPKDHFDALIAERSTRLQRASTWGVALGLVFTAGSLAYTARSLETSQEGQITDRYTKAIEQLGSKKIDVRLGAIYALGRLAHDSERDRETIGDVLSAYVREHDPKPKAKTPEQPDTDVQAALTVLGGLGGSAADPSRPRTACPCRLWGARIPAAQLIGHNLRDADLTRADLTGADLAGADLAGADLTDADLTRANLENADLENANLIGAKLTAAYLAGADLHRVYLFEANLRDAVLGGADLRGANLAGADLRGADLTGVKTDDATNLPSYVKTDDATKLPS
ncbi:pentapeptide repeat-containing protein [Nonomuraea salmonea]|uniref:pentapeptide repeat-containing protein n=1 Tax=Nonomuraea salmonea TaxID=46181 RepID=UPI002FEACC31